MVGEQREAAIHRKTTKGRESVFSCVYAVYHVCIPVNNFRSSPVDSIPSQKQHGVSTNSATSNTGNAMDVMHLFILRVNLLTCFFVFLSVKCMRWRDLHFLCIFVFSIIKAVLVVYHLWLFRFCFYFIFFWFSNRVLSLILYFYEFRGTIEQGLCY